MSLYRKVGKNQKSLFFFKKKEEVGSTKICHINYIHACLRYLTGILGNWEIFTFKCSNFSNKKKNPQKCQILNSASCVYIFFYPYLKKE